MKKFPERIIKYLLSQRLGVLAVEMLDGSPHGATVHFVYSPQAETFFFETYRNYKKAEPLFARQATRASFVVGQDESNMKTLQLDGAISLITKNSEKEVFEKVYFEAFPNKKNKYENDPNFVIFSFIPNWWRFTDWTGPNGKEIIGSEQ